MLITSSVQKLDPPLTQKIGDCVSGTHLLLHILNPFRQEKDYITQSDLNTQVMCASRYEETKLVNV